MELARECGYIESNRAAIIGEIVLAQWHIYRTDYALAEALRDLRHLIQNRREAEIVSQWTDLAARFDVLVRAELAKK